MSKKNKSFIADFFSNPVKYFLGFIIFLIAGTALLGICSEFALDAIDELIGVLPFATLVNSAIVSFAVSDLSGVRDVFEEYLNDNPAAAIFDEILKSTLLGMAIKLLAPVIDFLMNIITSHLTKMAQWAFSVVLTSMISAFIATWLTAVAWNLFDNYMTALSLWNILGKIILLLVMGAVFAVLVFTARVSTSLFFDYHRIGSTNLIVNIVVSVIMDFMIVTAMYFLVMSIKALLVQSYIIALIMFAVAFGVLVIFRAIKSL